MSKQTPCDDPEVGCPYDAVYSRDCEFHCGLGVDEDATPECEHDWQPTELRSGRVEWPQKAKVCTKCGVIITD